ncbi:RNA polymerase factor sigma-54 [candidate division WOR-3 bacterium]|nr:RNA polymerase factor sigma-54 [candidate division WOR-3 bacterium]
MPGKKGKINIAGPRPSISARLTVRPELRLTLHQKLFVELLPLANIDLIYEVVQRAEQNPLCDLEEPSQALDSQDIDTDDDNDETEKENFSEETIESFEKKSDIRLDEVFNDSVRTQWDRGGETFSPLSYLSVPNTLKDNLKIQYHIACEDKSLLDAGEFIIDSLDSDGYFSLNLADISMISGFKIDELQRALSKIKSLDPPGICSSGLEESLAIQLDRCGEKDSLAFKLVSQGGLNYLKNSDYKTIARKLKVSVSDVIEASNRIKKLNPRPASGDWFEKTQHIVPDFILVENDGAYELSALWGGSEIPFVRLTISRQQFNEIVSEMKKDILQNKRKESDLSDFIRQYHEALFLSRLPKYVRDRDNSIEKVARAIVARQFDYLRNLSSLKPLTEKEIAEETGLHASTVSRIVQNKYIETDRGLFPLKHFFTGHVKSDSAQICSSSEVREIIKSLVEEESPNSPYTDEELKAILKDRGFDVARRTIAKYRALMNILPSSMRKKIDNSKG